MIFKPHPKQLEFLNSKEKIQLYVGGLTGRTNKQWITDLYEKVLERMTTVERLEAERTRLHEYILMKLEKRDYHGVADAAMDLRELEVEIEYTSRENK